ncbi:MAG: glycosyltransferase [Kiritimatiellae bacterium]|nr:glycosyltransferase [Kiritimatiellia bacterium]
MTKDELIAYYDGMAAQRDMWLRKAWYYHRDLARFTRFVVPEGSSVVELGCGTGELLNALKPARGLGIDMSPAMIEAARRKHPHLEFVVDDVENLKTEEPFDYVVLSNLVGNLSDLQLAFQNMRRLTSPRSRVIITYYSRLWQPVLTLAEALGLKMRQPLQNWMSKEDVENLLDLCDYEVIRKGGRLICPAFIPGLSWFLNRIVAHLPGFRHLCLTTYVIARQRPAGRRAAYTVSIVIPTKDEAGNIFGAIERTPRMGPHQEYIFVDGGSTDGTVEKIGEVRAKYRDLDIRFMTQTGRGKANAVFEGFDAARGDVLMILDSDLTVPPEDLPKFYDVIAAGRAEFVNGCRLVYPMQKEAMRFLNMVANHVFALIFTWLLGFRIKDTLCGTKVLLRRDYELLKANRGYFGDFDPFGDFELIFGAARLNLRMADVPVRYRARVYGDIKIRRFRHGLLLLRMVFFAMRKLKFI